MATAGLRRAGAAARRSECFRARGARVKNREQFFRRSAPASGAGDFFARRENDGFEAVLALAAAVFENRHGFPLDV